MFRCYRCGRDVSVPAGLAHHELCPYCSSALHSCMNCMHYDEFRINKCSEPAADWVPDKQKANFCEFFTAMEMHVMKKSMEVDKARAYWESLWKKAL